MSAFLSTIVAGDVVAHGGKNYTVQSVVTAFDSTNQNQYYTITPTSGAVFSKFAASLVLSYKDNQGIQYWVATNGVGNQT